MLWKQLISHLVEKLVKVTHRFRGVRRLRQKSRELLDDRYSRSLALLLRGALEAEAKVGLKMNIAEKNLASLLASLPALRNPTISQLSQPGWVAVETIIDEAVVRHLIPELKAAGAEGIIEYPLNKVVY